MKKDVLNPLNWNLDQWYEALLSAMFTSFTLAITMTVIYIFH